MERFAYLALAVLAASGCRSETNYFCVVEGPIEDQGCFLCRDDGCEEVEPPVRGLCESSLDCAIGELCTDVGCVAQCVDESECPLGTTCTRDGLCLNPVEPTPTPVQDPQPDTPNTPDPPDPRDPPDPADPPDPPNEPPATGFCPEQACQPGRVCRQGQCRTPCETDEQCARVDATIRFCRTVGNERLCLKSSEVLASCQLAIDCGLGEECVGGNCVDSSESAGP